MSWISDIARPEIVALKPYEHASWEPHLERMHANELPWRADADENARPIIVTTTMIPFRKVTWRVTRSNRFMLSS